MSDLLPDSAAAQAELNEGDEFESLSPRALQALRANPTQALSLTVLRDGERLNISFDPATDNATRSVTHFIMKEGADERGCQLPH